MVSLDVGVLFLLVLPFILLCILSPLDIHFFVTFPLEVLLHPLLHQYYIQPHTIFCCNICRT
jgi:hypothetical protein